MLLDIGKICGNGVFEGNLSVIESRSSIAPFDIKRIYYTYGASAGTVRGFHAHKSLMQIILCVYGAIEIRLDNGNGEINEYILKSPDKAVFIGPKIWRTIKWLQDDSVLLVLASAHYDEADYIRNYDEFSKWINGDQ